MFDYKAYLGGEDEKPLDRLVDDGGLTSILRTVGIVGDSMSSGEFEGRREDGTNTYTDTFDYSWGQFLARAAGIKVYNMSRGGMNAKWYMETFADEMGFWGQARECNAFIIALGVNDLLNDHLPVGDISDVDFDDYTKNGKTFIGWYAQIAQKLRKIRPNAPLFFVTMPRDGANGEHRSPRHTELLYELASRMEKAYVIDLGKYAPAYDQEYKELFYLYGHLNAAGYYLSSKYIGSYIDYIIRHNLADFDFQHLA